MPTPFSTTHSRRLLPMPTRRPAVSMSPAIDVRYRRLLTSMAVPFSPTSC